jgi:hypothetical protein
VSIAEMGRQIGLIVVTAEPKRPPIQVDPGSTRERSAAAMRGCFAIRFHAWPP